MDWFKHDTTSLDDPDIQEAEDVFGDAGYAIFFKILEIYGKEFSHLKDGKLVISCTVLRRKLHKSLTKVEQILNFYQTKNRIFFETDGKYISIEVPKFIEKASNWTTRTLTKKTQLPTEAPTEAPYAREEEEEEEEEIEEDIYKHTSRPNCPYQKIVDLYHEVLPELSIIKSINGIKKSLGARWKESDERQNIDWWKNFFLTEIKESDFLMGRKTDFKANLGWIVGPKNFNKILNGQYLNHEAKEKPAIIPKEWTPER
uniref:DNA replication protein n=1 Tax=viral metagenome TaxID=1070528 RepID=A0A6H1ZFT4_9ZZZZ